MSYSDAVKRAADSGAFGQGTVENISLDNDKQKSFQLASNLFFVKLLINGNEKPIVVKTQPDHRVTSEDSFRNNLFVNEVCFYSKLLPFLINIDKSIADVFPKFIYGFAANGKDADKDCVILDDINQYGYVPCKLGKEMDIEHILLVLKKIGKFHALSYKAKKENPSEFRKLLSGLVNNDMSTMEEFIGAAMCSAPNCYKGGAASEQELELLKQVCCKDPVKTYQLSIKPKEPNAVLCHGDLCSNNLLFRYINDKPTDIILLDTQRCKYASPAIDLSFFLLYNTTKATKQHWDFFLHTYYESLRSAYEDVIIPSYSEFMKDFIEHITYGLATCSYFFRIASMQKHELQEFLNSQVNKKQKIIGNSGGDEGARLINEMLELLISKKYFH